MFKKWEKGHQQQLGYKVSLENSMSVFIFFCLPISSFPSYSQEKGNEGQFILTVIQNVWEWSYGTVYTHCDHVSARNIGKKGFMDKKALNMGLRLEIRAEKRENAKTS